MKQKDKHWLVFLFYEDIGFRTPDNVVVRVARRQWRLFSNDRSGAKTESPMSHSLGGGSTVKSVLPLFLFLMFMTEL